MTDQEGLLPSELIGRKRDGHELSERQLRTLVEGMLRGDVSEAQIAALLMAGVIRGFTTAEAKALTTILWESGETLDLSSLEGPTIDKHSTGGVGDGTTLIVAPLVAAAGGQMVKLSGRGLGHTGGTLDKLESVAGWRASLSNEDTPASMRPLGIARWSRSGAVVDSGISVAFLRRLPGRPLPCNEKTPT